MQPAKPSFDPDFSVAKLLEEHRILSKFEMVSYSKKSLQPTVIVTAEDTEDDKPMEQIPLVITKQKPAPSPTRKVNL